MATFNTIKDARKSVMDRKCPSVEIRHIRKPGHSKGGITRISYFVSNGCEITGYAFCWQFETYNKQNGKSIAFGRLMRNLKLTGVSKTKLRKHWDYVGGKIGNVNSKLVIKAFEGERIE